MKTIWHYIDDNNIYHLIKNEEEVLSIKLDEEYVAVCITTPNEVFEGPPELIRLTADVPLE